MKIFVGDNITTSYYASISDLSNWHCKGNYEVVQIDDVNNDESFLSFVVRDLDNPKEDFGSLNGFEYVNGIYRRTWRMVDQPSWHWERYPEPFPVDIEYLIIVKQKQQVELFV